jgi:hypothetical protein
MVAGVALGLGASVASAKPTDQAKNIKKPRPAVKQVHNEFPQADFFDDFESYKVGSDIVGQGGWELWYTGGQSAVVSDDHGSKNLKDHVLSDIVQQFAISDGQWTLSMDIYCPSDAPTPGEGYVILMSGYGGANLDQWNIQVRFDSSAFQIVEAQFGLGTLPIIMDKWVQFRAEIDLDADTVSLFYDNQVLWEGGYTEGVNGTGSTDIAALDLFSNSVDPIYYDNVSLKAAGGGCDPDLDGDGELTLFDFLKFVNLFNANDPIADWDGNGTFDLFDFLGYVNSFNAGC